jgi:large subunit ribosomal protein L25
MAQKINVQAINANTKGEVKRLRKSGYVPISLQHRGEPPLHLQAEAKPLTEFITNHGAATQVELEEEGGAHYDALVHDVQRDPVTHHLLHVTLQRLVRGEPIKSQVPVVLHGTPEAVTNRTALVQNSVEQVEVRCLPRNLPDHITVDISNMTYGEALRVGDLPRSDHYEILTAPDTVLASLVSVSKNAAEEAVAPPVAPPAA